jgi:hypothetical protein
MRRNERIEKKRVEKRGKDSREQKQDWTGCSNIK